MPTYTLDYITALGPQRSSFTLDDDRPVGPQVRRVLAEMQEHGTTLLGGRDDVLKIEWNGVSLDETLAPAAQGVTQHRPLELRMRPRHEAPVEFRVPPRTARPPRPFVPLGVISGALLGALGGSLAWMLLALLPVAADSAQDRDALAVAALLGIVGTLTVVGRYGRQRRLVVGLLVVVIGTILTAAVSTMVGAMSLELNQPFVMQRIALFGSVGVMGSITLALAAPKIGPPGAIGEVASFGLLAGVLAALLSSVESLGVTNALVWPAFGAAMGTVVVWPIMRRAFGLCEQMPVARTVWAPFKMRSFPLMEDGDVRMPDGLIVSERFGEVTWVSPFPISVAGGIPGERGTTVNGDHVRVGSVTYQFRELP